MFQNEKTLVKEITSPEGETEFQIRYIKEEGVGLATTRSGKNYLILDSLDYWFDCIQERYPPKRKCPCKNDYFRLRFSYTPRAGTEDFRSVSITSVCTSCGKERQIGEIDLKYSPTDHLFTQPLTFCPKPKSTPSTVIGISRFFEIFSHFWRSTPPLPTAAFGRRKNDGKSSRWKKAPCSPCFLRKSSATSPSTFPSSPLILPLLPACKTYGV